MYMGVLIFFYGGWNYGYGYVFGKLYVFKYKFKLVEKNKMFGKKNKIESIKWNMLYF